ncbi:DHH family phosphoesterase [Candidatus Woesearchaeota archaeon]|nr:DHH family phosphoesterase [Candidatus Woesearchaeota archaeon]
MALSKKQYAEIKLHLDSCKNPLFFFDDDQDGLCAFLLFYRYKKEGHGIVVKTSPKIENLVLNKINEYRPDKVFILDVAATDYEFLERVKVPVVWVDHHGQSKIENAYYYNPRISKPKDNQPTSFMCYNAVKQDLWIAALGCVADWFIPKFLNEFNKEYPDLIENYKNPGDIIYNSKLGKLIRIFSFILKGQHKEVMKSVKILTRIKNPYDILNCGTPEGKHVYNRYLEVNRVYEPILKDALKTIKNTKEKLAVYAYKDDKSAFTSDISNEALYRFPEKIIVIAREKNDEMKCSLRSSRINLIPIIEKSLAGLSGFGGGHENACGLNIKKGDFDEFLRRLNETI